MGVRPDEGVCSRAKDPDIPVESVASMFCISDLGTGPVTLEASLVVVVVGAARTNHLGVEHAGGRMSCRWICHRVGESRHMHYWTKGPFHHSG